MWITSPYPHDIIAAMETKPKVKHVRYPAWMKKGGDKVNQGHTYAEYLLIEAKKKARLAESAMKLKLSTAQDRLRKDE